MNILALVSYELGKILVCYDQYMFLTLTFDLSGDRELKSESFSVGFI